jgi:hypothetical protein
MTATAKTMTTKPPTTSPTITPMGVDFWDGGEVGEGEAAGTDKVPGASVLGVTRK